MTQQDTYKIVTDRIIAELEKGHIPWDKPWTGRAGGPISHATGEAYSLLNQMLLQKPGEYITFNQARKEGGYVRKGEKGHTIYAWNVVEVKDKRKDETKDPDKEEETKVYAFLRTHTVFHIDQCEGIKPKWAQPETRHHIDLVEAGEAVVADYQKLTGLQIDHVLSNEAFYSPSRDRIQMPLREQFKDTSEYYSTLFHEMVHSTGHPSRLNRFTENGNGGFGSKSYSKEELVAELGASILCHDLGIETAKSFRNNAAYIQSWIRALKNDTQLIVSAAGKADKAVNMIYGLNYAIERTQDAASNTVSEQAKAPAPAEPARKPSLNQQIMNADVKRDLAAAKKLDLPKEMSATDRIKAIQEHRKANPVQKTRTAGRHM